MPKALICEKWEFPLQEGDSGFFKHTNVSELSRRAVCFEWLVNDMPEGKQIAEYFGGIGLQSVILQNVVKPSQHHIVELDPVCVEQLSSLFNDNRTVFVYERDAKEWMPRNVSEAVFLDFPNMTAKHYADWEAPLGGLFATLPKVVEITDVGNRYLHLHRSLYSDILGCEITDIPSYIRGISKYLYERYNYSVFRAAYKSGTSYMMLAQGWFDNIDFKYVQSDKTGFRYIE